MMLALHSINRHELKAQTAFVSLCAECAESHETSATAASPSLIFLCD